MSKITIEPPPKGAKFGEYFITFGADPELFIQDNHGRIMGSEEVIPPKGLRYGVYDGNIVRDGVQVELHPPAMTCRANFGNSISNAFRFLKNTLDPKLASVTLASRVRVPKKTMDKLSDEAKRLGCMPSANIYPNTRPLETMHAAQTSLIRSAGGHIHLGVSKMCVRIPQLVQLLDIFVGIPCVMLDRDPEAARRRRYYGRAGEYREKTYGVEYRVLSNFWLKWYPLMSFVLAMARFACSMEQGYDPRAVKHYNFTDSFLAQFDLKKVQRAINRNDMEMAKDIWNKAVELASPLYSPDNYVNCPLDRHCVEAFEFLVEEGIDKWIPKDPVHHWINKGDGHYCGWETTCGHLLAKKNKKIA